MLVPPAKVEEFIDALVAQPYEAVYPVIGKPAPFSFLMLYLVVVSSEVCLTNSGALQQLPPLPTAGRDLCAAVA